MMKIVSLITILILFWSLLNEIWPNLIKKDKKCQLKDQKIWLKVQKSQLIPKESIKRLKMSFYIERVDLYWKSQSLLMYFPSLLIKFEHFNGFLSCWNQFCSDHLDLEFGSKKLIKRQFKTNSKQIFDLSGFNCQSL